MITLADLRARDALPVWQEAVAIVQALLDTTMAERRSASRLPDVTHIGLEEDGAVVLLPQGSIPEHPVRHLAAVLGVLIESIPAPPPLLDFVNRNLADPPEHATAEDFSRALKYFERPERSEDIRHVVERALGAPVHTDVEAAQRQLEARVQELVGPLADGLPLVLETTPAADDAPALAADDARVRSDAALAATDEPPADLPAMEPTAAVVRTRPSEEARREVQRAFDSELFRGLVPLTILAIVIGAGYVARDRKVDKTPGAVERVAAGALQAVDGAAAVAASNPLLSPQPAGASARAPGPGSTRVRPPRSQPVTPNSLPARLLGSLASTPQPVSTDGTLPAATGDPPSSPTGGPSAQAAAGASAAPTIDDGTAVSSSAPPGSSAEAAQPSDVEDDHVYSSDDPDIVPPELLRPGRSVIAPPGVPAALFELVITEAGKVAQVRQVSGVGAYRETMMRASLKAWRFQPARRDGRPVRYRLQVRVAV